MGKRIRKMPSVPPELIDELYSIMLLTKPRAEAIATSRQYVTECIGRLLNEHGREVFEEAVFLARRKLMENT